MIKIVIEYTHSRFKSQANNWGVYYGIIKKIFSKNDDFTFNEGDSICFVGDARFELKYKQLYSISGENIEQNQYGKQLQLQSISEYLDMNSPKDKENFLKTILTEKQLDSLKSKFIDPFELLENNMRDELMTVDGIGEVVVERLLERFNNTRDNAHVYAYFVELDLTNELISKLINYYGGDILLQKFKQNPYILVDDIKGIGFLKADEIAMKSKLVTHDSKERIFALTEYFLVEKLEGSTYIDINSFKKGIQAIIKKEVDSNKLDEIINEMYDKGIVFIDSGKKYIGLMKHYMLEKDIAAELKRIIESEPKIKIGEIITKEYVEEEIKKIEEEQGWEYTDEQIRAIKQCLVRNINIIYALAGSGKTTVVNAIIRILKQKGIRITQVALAGKASQRMEEVTKHPAYTIHRALKFVPDMGFTHNKFNPLETDVVILDETSMMPLDLFYNLIVAIDNGCKLIMLGDTGQLESVGIGNLFKDLIESNKIPKIELTKIHRQAQKSAIITNSIDIRNSKLIIEKDFLGHKILGELQDLELEISSHGKNLVDNIMKYFSKYYEKEKMDILDIQVVLPRQNDVVEVNNMIQNKINSSDIKISFTNKYEIRLGDKVINRKNNYNTRNLSGIKTPIFNGNIGMVKKIDLEKKTLIIDFENIGDIVFDFKDGNSLQLGYAITCHSAQGSQWKKVIVGINYGMFFLLSREWLYTAITRSSEHCVLVAENQALRYATRNSKISRKNTFLQKIL